MINIDLTNSENKCLVTTEGLDDENKFLQEYIGISNVILLAIFSKLLLLQKTSTAKNKKVAALAFNVETKESVCEAVNAPAKRVGICQDLNNETLEDIVHAETNVLLHLPNDNIADIVLFCTDSPCMNCAKNIISKNIETLIFIDLHKENYKSIFYLIANGTDCYRLVNKNGTLALENIFERYKLEIVKFTALLKTSPEKVLSQNQDYTQYSEKTLNTAFKKRAT